MGHCRKQPLLHRFTPQWPERKRYPGHKRKNTFMTMALPNLPGHQEVKFAGWKRACPNCSKHGHKTSSGRTPETTFKCRRATNELLGQIKFELTEEATSQWWLVSQMTFQNQCIDDWNIEDEPTKVPLPLCSLNDHRDSKTSTGHSDQHLPHTGCMWSWHVNALNLRSFLQPSLYVTVWFLKGGGYLLAWKVPHAYVPTFNNCLVTCWELKKLLKFKWWWVWWKGLLISTSYSKMCVGTCHVLA